MSTAFTIASLAAAVTRGVMYNVKYAGKSVQRFTNLLRMRINTESQKTIRKHLISCTYNEYRTQSCTAVELSQLLQSTERIVSDRKPFIKVFEELASR